MAREVPEMNLAQKLRCADRQAVALALPEGAALVEFVRYLVYDFLAVAARGESEWKPSRYLAFVLLAGRPDSPQMVDLGEAEPIDRMIATFRAATTGEDDTRGARDLGAVAAAPTSAPTSRPVADGADLYAAVFSPLLPALQGRTRLLLAPDGDLSRLAFEVLPSSPGRRLIDDYHVSYLGAGRDVVRFATASTTAAPHEPIVVADPDFDLGRAAARAGDTAMETARHSRDFSRESMHFGRLPGTRVEGERIAAMLGVTPWLDTSALEARLKSCRSPRILHLATHGFFLANQNAAGTGGHRGLGAWSEAATAGPAAKLGVDLENPLLRSGLALAGANTWCRGGTPPEGAEDGILTAEDVSGLDLGGTEMVVLSACETGLGEVRTGEGVFGLRRAFVLAGARTLVMSLWKVPDEQTQELMEDFYRRVLQGQPRAEALRDAQLALKARYPDPLYWGAFICQGDPRPLAKS
jgi:CHAT domain-containing protein